MTTQLLDERFETMPWELIDTVVFDVGNVLLEWNPKKIVAAMYPGNEALQQMLMEKVFTSPYWPEMDLGRMSLEEIRQKMIGDDRSLEKEITHVLEGWVYEMDPVDEGVKTLYQCKAHGKKTCVLSNFSAVFFAEACAMHPFFQQFDRMVVSGAEKLCKPDPAIYRLVTERTDTAPERTLFMDDVRKNVEAAMALGWQGLWIDRPEKLTTFFK